MKTDNYNYGSKANAAAISEDGKIYVAATNGKILVFNSDFSFLETLPISDTYKISGPKGIAITREGNIVVSDTGNNRIIVFTPEGQHIKTFGSKGTENSQFNTPMGVAVGPDGSIYVIDNQNHRIQKFDSLYTHVQTLGGIKPGKGATDFYLPTGIAVSKETGKIFVADSGNVRVTVFGGGLNYITSLDGVPYSSYNVVFAPEYFVFDKHGNMFIVEELNNRVVKLNRAKVYEGQVGTGMPGFGDNEFFNPRGAGIGPDGKIYVADTGNHRIQIFSPSFDYLATIGGVKGNGNNELSSPRHVAAGTDGRIYIADIGNNRIQVFDSNYEYLATIGSKGELSGQFDQPGNIVLVEDRWLHAMDRRNNRIQIIDTMDNYNVDNVIDLSDTGMKKPASNGLSYDPNGRVVFSDINPGGRVYLLNQSYGLIVSKLPEEILPGADVPGAAAFDPEGNLYVEYRNGPHILMVLNENLEVIDQFEPPVDTVTGNRNLELLK